MAIRLKRPKYVHVYTDNRGKTRVYLRRPGQHQVALPGPIHSPDFMQAYHKAMATPQEPKQAGVASVKSGTMNSLIVAYYASSAFTSLASSTQSTYRNQLEVFREDYGDLSVKGFKAKHADTILGTLAKTSTAQAHKLRKRLLMLMALAVKWDYRDDNPMLLASKINHKEKGYRTWTEEDIARYRKHWKQGTPQRLALEVLLHTGLRRSDACKLGRQHRQGNRHVVKIKKSGGTITVSIPVHATLEKHLEAVTGNLTYVVSKFGKGYTEESFSNLVCEAAEEAGLPPDSSPHGLRKACCRRLAESGCSTVQIMAITGQSLSVVERYIREYNKEKAAEAGMKKVKDKG